ncbi:tetratricopeptide repeat protein [Saccharothrix xinjiangensis]|uniref:tetratricopeptide repeat protein n=1 Tax=Saccharothrix xinjiangensis TaxID=204798 RepID=UPI0031D8559B
MRAGRPDDVFPGLAHPGAVGDEHAEALLAVAAVTARPSWDNVAGCVAVLERVGRALDPRTIEAATAVLELLLWQGPGTGPERVADVARLTARLARVTGPLPWGRYNLAVHALQAGDPVAAAGHLASGAVAPASGWPIPVLAAACAVIRGEPAALPPRLAEPVTDPDLVHDHRFFAGVHALFECLREDRPTGPARLDEVFDGPSGPLTRTVPQLSALKALLTDAVRDVPPRVGRADLRGCEWGRWLADRLHYAGHEATRVLSACATAGEGEPVGGGEPASAWQRLGSRQDLLPLLPEEDARALRRQVVGFREHRGGHDAPGAVWARLVDLRVALGGEPTTAEAAPHPEPGAKPDPKTNRESGPEPDPEPSPDSGPCPWWPADGALQAVARQEAEVERCYLEGRLLLRRGSPAGAVRRFARARGRLAGDGAATRLVLLRFGALLDYWEGVALAHLGRHEEAADLLRARVDGVKAREARAQLGLLAVAVGDLAGAVDLLASIPAPRPAAADYLAAVLAVREGDAAATGLLERLDARESAAGVYLAAGRRLRGRAHEAAGELAEATRQYRRALTRAPGDPVAAARLARVWLRQRHEGVEVDAEPLLDGRWSALTGVGWAAPLPLVRDCLDGVDPSSARELLDRVPADPGLRLLAVRSVVAAGGAEAAERALRAWVGEGPDPDPRLVTTARVARAAALVRDFCRAGGRGPARFELAGLERELRSGPVDPVTRFWAEAARLVLHPGSLAAAPPLPASDDGDRSAATRLFAGLMSVFSDDPEQRRAGARACRAVLGAEGAEPVADDGVRAAVRCLAAAALDDEQEFLRAYGEVEAGATALPCDPAAVYLAATEARLRAGDLDRVIDGFIPESLADLADPGVRRAMGVAYARRSVRTAERDPRAALRDLDQARELLGGTP